jgi:hypothetical protein
MSAGLVGRCDQSAHRWGMAVVPEGASLGQYTRIVIVAPRSYVAYASGHTRTASAIGRQARGPHDHTALDLPG